MARTLNLQDPRGKLDSLKTPALIVTTEMGMIPNLTPDISTSIPVFLSVCDFIENQLPKTSSIPISLGLGDRWIFFGPSSDFNNFDEGPSKKGIKLYSRNGSSYAVSNESYQELVDQISPNGVISLYSRILPGTSNRQSKNRTQSTIELVKKFSNTYTFTHEYCHDNSDIFTSLTENEDYQNLIKNTGIIFHYGDITPEIEENIKSKIALRSPTQPRLIICDGHPSDVRKLYSLGIDLFVLHMPLIAAQKGIALTFDFHEKNYKEIGINLKYKQYEHDHTPISAECDCTCCKQFMKSYIYHLFDVHEMLAETLLVQHNIRHYQRYLESLCEELSK